MKTSNKTSASEKQKTISIERILSLLLTSVWQAWTEPQSFKKWWGPEGYTCPDCTIDFRVGGKYIANMKAPDGKDNWSTGTYKEIMPQQKIVYTDSFADSKGNVVPAADYGMPKMPMQTLVTVELEEASGKTKMILHHAGMPVDYADDCEKGWQSCFDKMETNLK